jgi:hypothetical protein
MFNIDLRVEICKTWQRCETTLSFCPLNLVWSEFVVLEVMQKCEFLVCMITLVYLMLPTYRF